jgi:hypothetical protein
MVFGADGIATRWGSGMRSTPLLQHVLRDEALTRGLGDEEARILIEWLVEWAELLADESETEQAAWDGVRTLCRRARGIGRFVYLWSRHDSRGAAGQLAVSERFHWPLPDDDEDPAELMLRILIWEDRQLVL